MSRPDEWHIRDQRDSEWEDRYDDGYGSTEIHKGTTLSKYDLDEVFTSSGDGGFSVTLNADGTVTASGGSHYEEEYKFDQVSEDEGK